MNCPTFSQNPRTRGERHQTKHADTERQNDPQEDKKPADVTGSPSAYIQRQTGVQTDRQAKQTCRRTYLATAAMVDRRETVDSLAALSSSGGSFSELERRSFMSEGATTHTLLRFCLVVPSPALPLSLSRPFSVTISLLVGAASFCGHL